MATKNLDYNIRWQTDQAALNKTLQDAKRLDATIDSGVDQFVAMAKRGELSLDQLREALRDVSRVGDAEIDKITASLKEADKAAKDLQNTTETGLITESGKQLLREERLEGRFQSFALGTLGSIPGIGGSEAFGAGAAAFELIDALPNLKFSLNAVKDSVLENLAAIGISGAGAAGLVGGLGLAAIGFKLVTDELSRAREVALAYTAAQVEVNKLIASGGTREQVEAARDAAVADLESYERQIEKLTAAEEELADAREATIGFMTSEERDAAQERVAGARKALEELTGVSTTSFGFGNALRTTLADLQLKADAAAVSVAAATLALDENETAAADDAAALQRLTDQQLADAERALEIDNLTKAQRDDRAAANEREINVLTRLVGEGELTSDALLATANRITKLREETEELNGVSESYADTLERTEAALQSIDDQYDAYFDALEAEGEIRDKIAAINQKIADIQLETAQKVLQIEAEREERIAQITAEHSDKIGDLTAEGEEKRRDIIADSNEKIAKIQRDSGRKLFNLVAQRDALAHYLAAIEAAQQIQDEKDNAAKSLLEQKKAEDKALAQAVKAYDKALQAQNAAAEKQIRAAQDAANRALQTQYAYLNAEQVALQNQMIALQNIALFGSSGRRMIETQLWQDVNSIAVTWAFNTVNTVNSIFGAVFGGGGSSVNNGFLGPNGVGFGASQQAVLDRHFDRRYNQTLRAGRELIA